MSNNECNNGLINPKCLDCPTVKLYQEIIDQNRDFIKKITFWAMDKINQIKLQDQINKYDTNSEVIAELYSKIAIKQTEVVSNLIESNEQRIVSYSQLCNGSIKLKPSWLERILLDPEEEVKCSLDIQDQALMAPITATALNNRKIEIIKKIAYQQSKKTNQIIKNLV